MMRSASPRRLSIISRSLRMPSTTRSAGASGCRRRVASYRFTRSSSAASRNTIRYAMRRSFSSSSAFDSSPKNTPPRASTTIATRCGAARTWPRAPPSSEQRRRQVVDHEVAEVLERVRGLGAARAGQTRDDREAGRGPRLARRGPDARRRHQAVSRSRARAERPVRRARHAVQVVVDGARELGPTPGVCGDLLHARARCSRASEPNRFSSAFFRAGPDAGDVVERRAQGALLALLPVVGDGEPVRLVAQVLQHEQRLRPARDHRAGSGWSGK